MLSIDFIRKNKDKIQDSIKNRKLDTNLLEEFLVFDKKRVDLLDKIANINKSRNEIADKLKSERNDKLIAKGRDLKIQKDALEKELAPIESKYKELLYWLPNVFDESVPEGNGEDDNVEIYAWTPDDKVIPKDSLGVNNKSKDLMPKYSPHSKNHSFKLKDHIELGEMHDIIDVKQSAKVSGSRFSYLKKEAVILQWALVDHISKKLIKDGFYPINPPLLVKERSLFGTSHFPQEKDQVYSVDSSKTEDNNQLYLVGSSEPSNFSYFMDKVINEEDLPQMLFANTVCFRTEVGSWGKDVRGIKRVHQFDKVELAIISTPDKSKEYFYKLIDINKWFWESLEIPFHVILKCKADSGYLASSIQADVEAWIPSQNNFMEVGTATNATDYQSRRLNIKYKDNADGSLNFVHTLNDTGVALGRALIAIIDNYQQEDGSILIPKVLQEYTGFDIIKKS